MDAVNVAPADELSARTALYKDSSFREKLIEHVFVGEILRVLWRRGVRNVEVLRAEVDRGGYDLVLECRGVVRHVQLKSSHREAKTSEVAVSLNLSAKASGCVIWVLFDSATLELGPFLWFGSLPGKPLPPLGDKAGRHSKADSTGLKAERPNLRVVTRRRFAVLATMEDVANALFGTNELSGFQRC